MGTKAALARYRSEHIHAFVRRTHTTDQMVFSSIGNIAPRRIEAIAARYFADMPASVRSICRTAPAPVAPFERSIARHTHQSHCIVGARAYGILDPKRLPLALLVNMLGGPSANSMLNVTVREKHGLSYSIEGSYTPYGDAGIVAIYFSSDHDNCDRCLELVRGQIDSLRTRRLSTRRLALAKKQFVAQLAISMESNEGYMLGAGKSYLVHSEVDTMEEVYRKISDLQAGGAVGGCQRSARLAFATRLQMMDALEKYIDSLSTPESELLRALDHETHMQTIQPRMLSGHIQGKLLEMFVRMLRPRSILEIGTFTGYSALSMAAGLGEGATLDTIEVDDELEELAQRFFDRSPCGGKIRLHIGSALDIAPTLGGPFDLVFIDGDKREYPAYYRMLMGDDTGRPLVESGSFLLADNILWSGKVVAPVAHNDLHTQRILEFNRTVADDPRVENVIVPLRRPESDTGEINIRRKR